MKNFEEKVNEINKLSEEKKLNKNQRICPKCKDILTSESNYDFKKCCCGYLTIDGGNEDYLRIIIEE